MLWTWVNAELFIILFFIYSSNVTIEDTVLEYYVKCTLYILLFLQAISDNVCKAAGCKAIWGFGNQLFVTAGSRKPFRGNCFFIFVFGK